MWDRPDLLNRTSNALFAFAVLLIAFGALWWVVHMPQFALREVRVLGEARHITRAQIEAIVEKEVSGTFFTLNLPRLRSGFEKLPWIREVTLRRRWPARLEVVVVEHVPLARWGNTALVNTQGEVFQAAYDGKLPTFIGPEGTAKEIAIQYDFFRRQLAAIDAQPGLIQMSPRRAWQVKIEGGPTLQLGREDVEARIARYLAVHSRTVGALKRRIDYVDLRYADGFAVRIAELKGEPAAAGRAAKPAAKRKVRPGESAARRISASLRPQRSEGAAAEESAARRISASLRPQRSEGAA
jgi:cell division protein FtsQ